MKKVLVLGMVLLLVLACALALSACKEKAEEPEPASEEAALETLEPGKLTVATGEPAYPPYVEENDPTNGKGFEAAVTYAVAEKLGFAAEDVVWVRTGFDEAITPGPKSFDLNIQQYSVTEERKAAVDFSSPYYVTSQAVISNAKSKFANAKTLADLDGAKVGAAAGSTSLEVAQATFKDAAVFNDNDAAKLALESGQVDALVVDIPTAHYMVGVELEDGKIVGEIAGSEGGDELAFLLPKDSPLTGAVTAAVDELRADGTLAALAEQWLVAAADAVILK
jgi:polar amino acid transport system substrate-binding protein